MLVNVTKHDGSLQLFDRHKVIRTARNFGISRNDVETIADIVEAQIYEGICTEEILRLIHQQAMTYHPEVAWRVDLRRALSIIPPKPDFEIFVRLLLREQGYEVEPNQVVRGKCGEHEADAIATKDGCTFFVEVKHHHNYHTPTGLDDGRIARAIIEDLSEGVSDGKNRFRTDKAMIVCNTKLSDHAKRYALCREIVHIGWGNPPDHDIRRMIEEKKMYPVFILKDVDSSTGEKLTNAGIVTLRQLESETSERIARKTGIDERRARKLIERATALLTIGFKDQ